MGGKGRGLGQDGSNRQILTLHRWIWGKTGGCSKVLVWITTCFP